MPPPLPRSLVRVVEGYRSETDAGLLDVSHVPTLLERWCDRTPHWDRLAAS